MMYKNNNNKYVFYYKINVMPFKVIDYKNS